MPEEVRSAMTFMVSKLTGETLVFFPLDEETGEVMDDLYHLRRLRDEHHAQRLLSGERVCRECGRPWACSEYKALRDAVNAEQSRLRMQTLGERERRPYKRADIPTGVVLASVIVYHFRSWDVLCETYPWKVVHAAYLRDARRGLIEFGTSERRPWLTPEGKAWVEHERRKCVVD